MMFCTTKAIKLWCQNKPTVLYYRIECVCIFDDVVLSDLPDTPDTLLIVATTLHVKVSVVSPNTLLAFMHILYMQVNDIIDSCVACKRVNFQNEVV